MNYSGLDECMQALIQQVIPISDAQKERICQFCTSLILARNCHLPDMARWLGREANQVNREQWLRRLLDAPFISQELIYQPWLKQALRGYKPKCWHLVIDRSHFSKIEDIVVIGLAYHKRALPLAWIQVPYGGAPIQTYIELIESCKSLIPSDVQVIFHGDAEFGAVAMIQYLHQQAWDFILAQRCHYKYRELGDNQWQTFRDIAVSKRQPIYLSDIILTRQYQYKSVNLFGFVQKGKKGKDETRFYATSLPITPTLRQIGKRRWSIECCFQDYKSAGLELTHTRILCSEARNRLFVLASVCYLWLTCLGRWLCKTEQRHLVDSHCPRHLSFYRIGWDWVIYQFRRQQTIPQYLTLYS